MEAAYKLCELQESIRKDAYKNDAEKAKAFEKKSCLEGKVIDLEKLEAKWETAKAGYRNNNASL
ncbi:MULTISPECIES: hypothetical protein [Sphingobacterium]|uniref:hypothetical protein n=1 Tax=Sphingobacterium TaxID=28453 RepID=UPI0013D97E3F|nr:MULTISPECIES: hypothetical protein [unclassified Sphingobacterium]